MPAGDTERLSLPLGDLDRVLGGGLTPGSLALLAGAPGIGKSTLLLQVAAGIAARGDSVLYASGEESAEQVRTRADRVGGACRDVLFVSEPVAERIVEAAATTRPRLLCVDSIQTATTGEAGSAPGSVSRVRESAAVFQEFAKRTGTPTVLVGHVTKGGGIAGPKTLEHLVDVVLIFEGLRGEDARVLRAGKNRFGRVGELALFRMADGGLAPVRDPTRTALERRVAGPGSALTLSMEGARPVAVEVQALTMSSPQSAPRRMTTGFSPRRLAMLIAVLGRHAGVALDRSEVFVNVVGGLRISDPATDAGVLAALASSELDRPLAPRAAFLGEVGLSGELRALGEREARLGELVRLGIADVVLPATSTAESHEGTPRLHPIRTARELVQWVASRAAETDGG